MVLTLQVSRALRGNCFRVASPAFCCQRYISSSASARSSIKIPTGILQAPSLSIPKASETLLNSSSEWRYASIPETPSLDTTLLIIPAGLQKVLLEIPGFPFPYTPPTSVYRIGSAGVAGLGVFATVDLEAGDTIIIERPALIFPMQWKNGVERILDRGIHEFLSPERRIQCYNLENCRASDVEPPWRGILLTNGLPFGELPGPFKGDYGALCPHISRVNHSCSPNAIFTANPLSLTMSLRAFRSISAGEEIFISYPGSHYSLSAVRRVELWLKYRFVCLCSSCRLRQPEAARSNMLRRILGFEIDDVDPTGESKLKEWLKDTSRSDYEAIEYSERMMYVMESEGFQDKYLWCPHIQRLCKAYCALEDAEGARTWAKKAAGLTRAITGEDGGWDEVAAAPEKTDWWGLRAKYCTGQETA